MGTWGTAITSDDTVSDVVAFMVECLKAGTDLHETTEETLRKFRESLADTDDAPLIWLGIAHTQWKYGVVSQAVLSHIQDDVTLERGLERWREDSALLRKRKDALAAFLAKISTPNQKPAKIPKIVNRPAPYAPGDCLSVLTKDLRYTAAIVLAVNNSNIEYGANLVGSLDFLADEPPTPNVFEARKWLYKHHGNWKGEQELIWFGPTGFKKEQARFAVVYRTRLRFFDPQRVNSFGSWGMLGAQILHCRAASEA